MFENPTGGDGGGAGMQFNQVFLKCFQVTIEWSETIAFFCF